MVEVHSTTIRTYNTNQLFSSAKRLALLWPIINQPDISVRRRGVHKTNCALEEAKKNPTVFFTVLPAYNANNSFSQGNDFLGRELRAIF